MLNKKLMSEFVSVHYNLPIGRAENIVSGLLDHIYLHLLNGEKVKLTNIGILGGIVKTSSGRNKVKFKTSQTILNQELGNG